MKIALRHRYLIIAACVFCLTVPGVEAKNVVPGSGHKVTHTSTSAPNTSITLRGGISALAGACAGAGISIEASTLPTTITKVRMGTPAAYAGVCQGDRLIQGAIGSNSMQLLIDRGGKRYSVNLRYTPDNLVITERKKKEQLRLAAELSKDADWKTLKQYDIALLIDASGSMENELEGAGESKWQWCLEQIYSFAQEAQTLGNGSFDFCTFNTQTQRRQRCTAPEARLLMTMLRPEGGTDLSTPLADMLHARLKEQHTRPYLVVIVSDGMPNQGPPVEQVIIDTAKQMKHEQDMRIIFLQIGNDGSGKLLANYLDNSLVMEGAPFDIVSSIQSEDLVDLGLRRGLVAALNQGVRDSAGTGFKQANPQMDAELARVRAELARLRAQNAGQAR